MVSRHVGTSHVIDLVQFVWFLGLQQHYLQPRGISHCCEVNIRDGGCHQPTMNSEMANSTSRHRWVKPASKWWHMVIPTNHQQRYGITVGTCRPTTIGWLIFPFIMISNRWTHSLMVMAQGHFRTKTWKEKRCGHPKATAVTPLLINSRMFVHCPRWPHETWMVYDGLLWSAMGYGCLNPYGWGLIAIYAEHIGRDFFVHALIEPGPHSGCRKWP